MPQTHSVWTSAIAAALSCVTALFPLTPACAQSPALPKEGLVLLETHCARCHAVGLDGESAMPKAPRMRDIASKYRPQNLAESLAEGIVTGHPNMPQFVFEPPEINAIIVYLQALRDRKP